MGLFEKLFPLANQPIQNQTSASYWKTLTAYQPVFRTWGGAIYESERVRSAIDSKARHISKLKVEFVGSAKPTLSRFCKHAPNAYMTWSQFLYRTATILDVQNTAFIVPIKDEYGRISGYYPLLPSRCEIVDYKNEPYLRYKFATGETAAERLVECGILTKFQYGDDFFGESNRALNPTMELVNINNQGIEEAVKNSNSFRLMAKMSNFSLTEDLEKEQRRFTEKLFRSDDSSILLFPNTYNDIRQLEVKPFVVDAEQMAIIDKNVQNYFGVNEKVMQGSAIGDELDAFFNSSIEPFSIQLSEVLTQMTFTLRERSEGNEIIVNANRLQYMPTSEKISMIQQMGDRGMMTINEARELFNYPPIEGGDIAPIRGEYYGVADKLGEGEENGNQE